MWKWLGGCLVIVVLLIAGGSWWAFQKMQSEISPDGSLSVSIKATPQRVFASLANGDSLSTWMSAGNSVSTPRRGQLTIGDTIRVTLRATIGVPRQHLTWQVAEIVPEKLLVLKLRPDTTKKFLMVQRDSLVTAGDSTRVVVTMESPALNAGSGANGMTGTLMLSMFRMGSKLDLIQLKERIEHGRAAIHR